jgi:hypothetical protein
LYRDQSKANTHERSHRDPGHDHSATLVGCDRSGNHADHDRVIASEHQVHENYLQKRTELIEEHKRRQ